MPFPRRRALVCFTILVQVAATLACSDSASDGPSRSDAGVEVFPPARTDRVPAVGSDATLDVATWNLENFPHAADSPETVADLIASLDLDLVAVEEVGSVDAFDEVIARLRGYDGVLSNHTYQDGTYQKIGFIFRTSVVTVDSPALLFQNNGYELPRPPLAVHVQVLGGAGLDFDAIGVHLKAGLGGEDIDRRTQALTLLEGHVRTSVDGSGDDDVIVLGDFNETLDKGADVMGTFLSDSSRYHFQTQPLQDAGRFSFVPSESLIDHMVTTVALADETAAATVTIPDLLHEMTDYSGTVSDHLPVVLSFPVSL